MAPNHLARETSPYLLQHRNNPVDWFPWGEEALARARTEDKPILLSVGYFACHWCHVMEHECFENEAIAKLMNQNFVCIKVDREERPDLDQIYQLVAQAMTRSGGWPLTVFLTPDLKPFFGGTYFPPDDRYGRPGFPRVLAALADAYRNERASVAENASRITDFIRQVDESRAGHDGSAVGGPQGPREALDTGASRLFDAVDAQDGGFSGAPKFPNVPAFTFLWRYGIAADSARARDAVLVALDKMARGGILDQLGGGFHRYSVDDHWAVPHFEKMLYDNGLLLRLYSEALVGGELSKDRRELYLDTVAATVSYLLREMRSPEGLFYAAQDADSEGEEGKYFVWSPQDLAAALAADEARAFALRYGVDEGGNFEHGKTVLYQARTVAETAAALDIAEPEARARLAHACEKLARVRAGRVPPGTDTKALASWNALAISGLGWAAQALAPSAGACGGASRDGADAVAAAARAAQAAAARQGALAAYRAVRARLARSGAGADGARLLHSTLQRDSDGAGVAKHAAHLEDYAYLAQAAIDVARFAAEDTGELERCLDDADAWLGVITSSFATPERRGYFFTSVDHETLLQRPRSLNDQATPSGTAVALEAMAALAAIDWKGASARYEPELSVQLAALLPAAARNPYAASELLSFALLSTLGPVTLNGQGQRDACRHAHVFLKPPLEGKAVLCHRQTCTDVVDSASAWSEALARCRFVR